MIDEDQALRDYNTAFVRWLFCLDSEEKQAKEALDEARSIWINL